MRGKAPKCLQRGKATLSLFQNLRNVQAKQRALSKTSCNVYDMLRKYHHHHSSFWHLLYDNNQWKISNWSEIISWRIFAQSRLYAFLKKHFPEITTIACRTKIPCVCVLKICIELYLLPSSPRLLYFRCMTTLVCLDAFSHTYRNINISNLRYLQDLQYSNSQPFKTTLRFAINSIYLYSCDRLVWDSSGLTSLIQILPYQMLNFFFMYILWGLRWQSSAFPCLGL